MGMNKKLYEILVSEGSGTAKGPRFQKLADALRHVSEYGGGGSLAIRCPDGSFYRWEVDKAALKNQRKHPRSTVLHAAKLGYLDVVVRTVSKAGLSVILPSTQEVTPGHHEKVHLELNHKLIELPVEVVWFQNSQAGLKLDSNISSVDKRRWESWVAGQS